MVVMAHGVNAEMKRSGKGGGVGDAKTGIGSRRIFPPHFKLQVLDSYRKDADCKGNQRATARKYGIHRRQIQKWLQAEGNLRNSVVMVSAKAATGLGGAASAAAVAAAAAVIGVGVGGAESEARKCGHVEMSLSRRQRDDAPLDSYPPQQQTTAASRVPALSPSSYSSYQEIAMTTTTTTTMTTTIMSDDNNHWQPLDFSTQSREAPIDLSLKRPTPSPSPATSPPPIYAPTATSLPPQHPDIWDLSTKPKPTKLFKPYDLDDFHNNNNNNNSSSNNYNYNDTYTLHELRPHIYQCYQTSYPHMYYEDQTHILKQRHSYSLDFKLNAIESYYQDDSCKGNQRAVASKYNIHRRQVQKWLKQEDELRQRNDHAHTVR
ncbi:PREDICTED: uncharacterized protein LOC108561395 [Nicrophorus vespilloides]|uniref:Uncharacterized protein LOC108561395 n=1 Tax=Nicrophorus vespilloides TaxID=110193 RepID=A0ABM1MJP7_NICVS|nr:PREDICTED: uncharacterized protein LOC108561395 [Nicrophorus vespilloides]